MTAASENVATGERKIMAVVKADLEKCQGYANCVVGADDVFDLGDDGVVVLLRTEIDEAERAQVTDAARSCPVSALTVEDA
ncbi:MAG TPA: ferredoxin [Pseudonocardiaceae bacterium]|jgi:3-phenylpropionate/trans-cinnamate dioxygenase ferredoxin reductase subunit|nr:ferredoxin [Pseudonocardiaceae bacterium]